MLLEIRLSIALMKTSSRDVNSAHDTHRTTNDLELLCLILKLARDKNLSLHMRFILLQLMVEMTPINPLCIYPRIA